MADENEAVKRVVKAIDDGVYALSDHGIDPHRPYDGQPHTDQGERGKTLVSGLTYRDVADCFVRGWLYSSDKGHSVAETGELTYNDIYELGGECEVDPLAVMKNMLVEMERRQGIYPNVPRLQPEE